MINDINEKIINNCLFMIYSYKHNIPNYFNIFLYQIIIYYSMTSGCVISLYTIYNMYDKNNPIYKYYGTIFITYVFMVIMISFWISYILMFSYQLIVQLYNNIYNNMRIIFNDDSIYQEYIHILNTIIIFFNITFFIFGLGEFLYHNTNYKIYNVYYNIKLFIYDLLNIIFNTIHIYIYVFIFNLFTSIVINIVCSSKIYINKHLFNFYKIYDKYHQSSNNNFNNTDNQNLNNDNNNDKYSDIAVVNNDDENIDNLNCNFNHDQRNISAAALISK